MEYLQKIYDNNNLNKEELIGFMKSLNSENSNKLFEAANKTRKKYYGNKVYMRGLIEFSNICRNNCLYCGLRASNTKVKRYRLTTNEILECCEEGYRLGYRTFVLQSGEDMWYTKEILVDLIKKVKEKFPDVALTLSIGERPYNEYESFFKSGADRFLLRHETASKKLYEKLHPDMLFEDRVDCLNNLKEIGYQVGAGFMVGLPDQGYEELAEDLIFLKNLEPDMIGIGPFIPHSATPMGNEQGGTIDKTLIMIALVRLLVPDVLLPATTAMGTLNPQGRELALKAGVIGVLSNISSICVSYKYQLYENKICIDDEASKYSGYIEKRINAAGFILDTTRGDSIKYLCLK